MFGAHIILTRIAMPHEVLDRVCWIDLVVDSTKVAVVLVERVNSTAVAFLSQTVAFEHLMTVLAEPAVRADDVVCAVSTSVRLLNLGSHPEIVPASFAYLLTVLWKRWRKLAF